MRTRYTLLAAALVAALLTAAPALAAATVGEAAPAFSLQDLDGKRHALADYQGKVVVLEWINPNCPVSDRHAKEETMTRLHEQHGDVVWLAINSTNPDSRDFVPADEHREWAAKRGIDYTILYDQSGDVGRAYGAQTTPHMYIVDEAGELAYNGAIDDDPPGRRKAAERTNYVGTGLVAHKVGQDVSPATTKPYGCSVKY
jgi:peroxiredoxin